MSPSDAPVLVLYESSVQLLVDYATERFNDDSVEFAARAAYWDMAISRLLVVNQRALARAESVVLQGGKGNGG